MKRAAALADEVAAGAPVAAARELRTVEDSLALTLVGRRRLRILAPEDQEVDLPLRSAEQAARDRFRHRRLRAVDPDAEVPAWGQS